MGAATALSTGGDAFGARLGGGISYDVGSVEASECVGDATSDCPAFDSLMGSRMLVANLELRFPRVGLFTGDFDYGPIPWRVSSSGTRAWHGPTMASPSSWAGIAASCAAPAPAFA